MYLADLVLEYDKVKTECGIRGTCGKDGVARADRLAFIRKVIMVHEMNTCQECNLKAKTKAYFDSWSRFAPNSNLYKEMVSSASAACIGLDI